MYKSKKQFARNMRQKNLDLVLSALWLTVENNVGVEPSNWLKKLVRSVLTNKSVPTGCQPTMAKPKATVTCLRRIFPRFAAVAWFPALNTPGCVFPALDTSCLFPRLTPVGMFLLRDLTGSARFLCQYFGFDFTTVNGNRSIAILSQLI